MSEPKKVHVGEVLPPRGISAFDGFAALTQIVDAVQDCVKVHAVESTKQAHLAAYEATEVARIKAAESVLKQFFEQSFEERRSNFTELFDRLDAALDRGDQQAVSTVLTGIVEIARTSPLANMGDLGQIRAALDDPDHVWEF
ncbi:hypothetical protein ACWDTG_23195 [Rhodococcus zopfii]|uniref:hypothetical protein n=1 Tax=Rhodococcus zopfii TaxID=43772 RepID=UPI001111425B|nr:hypothetical protein [Rhodococcus zopfii]